MLIEINSWSLAFDKSSLSEMKFSILSTKPFYNLNTFLAKMDPSFTSSKILLE
jgi:hypothetical protein